MIWSPSLQSLAERLCPLPGLFVAYVNVAHRRAHIFVPQQLLNFPQIFSHLIKQNWSRGIRKSLV